MNSFPRLRDLRRAPLALAFLLALAFAPGAHAYELVEVRSGGEIVVSYEGRRVTLVLAGVWVPDPPLPGYQPVAPPATGPRPPGPAAGSG